MTDAVLYARILMCTMGIFPVLVAALWGQYNDRMRQNSPEKFAVWFVVLVLIFGTAVAQGYVYYLIAGISGPDTFQRILYPANWFVGLVVYYIVVFRHDKEVRRKKAGAEGGQAGGEEGNAFLGKPHWWWSFPAWFRVSVYLAIAATMGFEVYVKYAL